MDSAFDRMGGETALRPIINDFIDQVFDDQMIGFFFARASKHRIKEMEYQHAAEHLGAPIKYEGRALGVAHRPHRIMGGQFARRLAILKKVLQKHQVRQDIIEGWLRHNETLRPLITKDPGSECR